MTNPPWTLPQLLEQLHARLAQLAPPQDPRVTRRPDRRVFRYYAARGLVDGPTALRGRQGLYGARQLHQLLAIRRLQAAGWTLDRIQARLGDLDDASLMALADPPATSNSPEPWQTLSLDRNVELRLRSELPIHSREARRLRRLAQPLLRRLGARRAGVEGKGDGSD